MHEEVHFMHLHCAFTFISCVVMLLHVYFCVVLLRSVKHKRCPAGMLKHESYFMFKSGSPAQLGCQRDFACDNGSHPVNICPLAPPIAANQHAIRARHWYEAADGKQCLALRGCTHSYKSCSA